MSAALAAGGRGWEERGREAGGGRAAVGLASSVAGSALECAVRRGPPGQLLNVARRTPGTAPASMQVPETLKDRGIVAFEPTPKRSLRARRLYKCGGVLIDSPGQMNRGIQWDDPRWEACHRALDSVSSTRGYQKYATARTRARATALL